MSMGIDGFVEVVADVVGGIAYGIGQTAVVVGTALGKSTIALAKMTARAATEVGSAIADSFREVAQIHKLMSEQRKKAREAYDKYTEEVKADEAKQKEYIEKLKNLINFDALSIGEEGRQKIDRQEGAKKIQVLNDVIDMQSQFERLRDLFFGLSEMGVELDCEYDFYAIKAEFAKKVNSGDFDFTALNEKIDLLFQAIRDFKTEDDKKDVVEFITAQIYKIENELDVPQLLCFSTELYEMLRVESEDAATSPEDALFEMERNIWQLAQLFFQIDYDFPEMGEVVALLNSVKTELLSDNSVATKLEWIETRYRCLMDTYRKICARDEEVIALKQRYNEAIALNYTLKEELSLELPVMDFHYATAERDIAALAAENEMLAQKLAEKQKQEYIRKTVREAMREMQFEYLCSQTKTTSSDQTVYEDIYHIENGNVVSVTFVNGRAYYSVSGVEIAGITASKKSIASSMEKMCSKSKELQDRLKSKGVIYTIDRRIEPREEYAHEIKLDNAPASVIERLRKAKLGKTQSPDSKEKKIG